jgi:hypothetical protein
MNATQAIDLGQYIILANGDMKRKDNLEPLQVLRHEFARDSVEGAIDLQETMIKHKQRFASELEAFMETAFQEHGVDYRGFENGVKFESLDGRYRVKVERYETVAATEEALAALSLMMEYLNETTAEAAEEVKELVKKLSRTGSGGEVSVNQLNRLKRLGAHIKDERWKKAIGIIDDAMYVSNVKRVYRFYKKREEGEGYEYITLLYSALPEKPEDATAADEAA